MFFISLLFSTSIAHRCEDVAAQNSVRDKKQIEFAPFDGNGKFFFLSLSIHVRGTLFLLFFSPGHNRSMFNVEKKLQAKS